MRRMVKKAVRNAGKAFTNEGIQLQLLAKAYHNNYSLGHSLKSIYPNFSYH